MNKKLALSVLVFTLITIMTMVVVDLIHHPLANSDNLLQPHCDLTYCY